MRLNSIKKIRRDRWLLKLSNKMLSKLIVEKLDSQLSNKPLSSVIPWWYQMSFARKNKVNKKVSRRRTTNLWRNFNTSLNATSTSFKKSRKYITLAAFMKTTGLLHRKIKNFYIDSNLTPSATTYKRKIGWYKYLQKNKRLKRYLVLQSRYQHNFDRYKAVNQLSVKNALSLRSYPKPSLYDLNVLFIYQRFADKDMSINMKEIDASTGWRWYVFLKHYKKLPFKKKASQKKKVVKRHAKRKVKKVKIKQKIDLSATYQLEKQKHLFHFIWQRYRWVYNPKIRQFKIFKKFFKRSLKRFRRINKNKLFITKFRNYFAQLSGLSERGIFVMWRSLRRSYNEYSGLSSLLSRFSQTLQLMPLHLLVFLRIAPSIAASRLILKSGSVYINGLAATGDLQMRPGDIMQLNNSFIKHVRLFFLYQKWWTFELNSVKHISFLQIDWSSSMFLILNWPLPHQLLSSSFLSERWVRYYIRHLPVRARKYKQFLGNWKVYKKFPKR